MVFLYGEFVDFLWPLLRSHGLLNLAQCKSDFRSSQQYQCLVGFAFLTKAKLNKIHLFFKNRRNPFRVSPQLISCLISYFKMFYYLEDAPGCRLVHDFLYDLTNCNLGVVIRECCNSKSLKTALLILNWNNLVLLDPVEIRARKMRDYLQQFRRTKKLINCAVHYICVTTLMNSFSYQARQTPEVLNSAICLERGLGAWCWKLVLKNPEVREELFSCNSISPENSMLFDFLTIILEDFPEFYVPKVVILEALLNDYDIITAAFKRMKLGDPSSHMLFLILLKAYRSQVINAIISDVKQSEDMKSPHNILNILFDFETRDPNRSDVPLLNMWEQFCDHFKIENGIILNDASEVELKDMIFRYCLPVQLARFHSLTSDSIRKQGIEEALVLDGVFGLLQFLLSVKGTELRDLLTAELLMKMKLTLRSPMLFLVCGFLLFVKALVKSTAIQLHKLLCEFGIIDEIFRFYEKFRWRDNIAIARVRDLFRLVITGGYKTSFIQQYCKENHAEQYSQIHKHVFKIYSLRQQPVEVRHLNLED